MMLEMARKYSEGTIHLRKIAKKQNVSAKYLEQIIMPLKRAGFVEGVRGRNGGHKLSKPPHEITVGQIVQLVEHERALSPCVDSPDYCSRSHSCPARTVWVDATNALYESLYSVTLKDLLNREPPDSQEMKAE